MLPHSPQCFDLPAQARSANAGPGFWLIQPRAGIEEEVGGGGELMCLGGLERERAVK